MTAISLRRCAWLLLLSLAAGHASTAAAAAALDMTDVTQNTVFPIFAVKSLNNVSGIAGLLSTVQLMSGQSLALQTMFNTNQPATVLVPSDEALRSFASAVGPSYTSKNLLDAFSTSPQLFWSLMSNQIINDTALRPQQMTDGKTYTALGGAKLSFRKNSAGSWVVNDIAAIDPKYVVASQTALCAVSRFITPPDTATWAPLLTSAVATATAPASPAPSSTTSSSTGSSAPSPYTRIGIGIGISVGFALVVALASLLCVMYRRRKQEIAKDPWQMHNAPSTVVAAAAAAGSSPFRRRRRFLGFRSKPQAASRTNHHATSSISSGSSSTSIFAGINRWRTTGTVFATKDVGAPVLPTTIAMPNGVGLRNTAAYPVGSPAMIAPLSSVNSGDSSDEDEDTLTHHHSHRITSGVPEGIEGLDHITSEPQDFENMELGWGSAVGAAIAAAPAGFWLPDQLQPNVPPSVPQGDPRYPGIFAGAVARGPGSPTSVCGQIVPKVTEERLQIFIAQWHESGSPGGRVPRTAGVYNNGNTSPKATNKKRTCIRDSEASDDDQCQRDQLDGCDSSASCTTQESIQLRPAVSAEIVALGPWAANALRPGGACDHSLVLRQVVMDLAAGRHPVTHNFTMKDHQTPIARHNTVVLFAHNKNNNKRATIKFYAPRSPGYAAETSAYYQMASRHLPFLESTFNSPDGSYASALVLECGDRSLREALEQHRPTDLPQKLEMFHQLVLAVRHMHSHNLVHRDIQPKHLLFCSEGLQWKLIDFSTTVPANSMVVPEVLSVEYCAPEVAEAVARGDRVMVATPAADMWSVGVMAYEMATGQPFYPAHWSNEEIWRSLLGFMPLPCETLDIVAQAAPGERAFMKKVAHLLQRNPMLRMTADRLASSRLFSACAATTTSVPSHAVQHLTLAAGEYAAEGGRELYKRLGSITRALEKIGFIVAESNALGVDILKQMTVNSLILSVNLQELRPRNTAALPACPLAERIPGVDGGGQMYSSGRMLETPSGPQPLTAGLSIGQAGALGLVDKSAAPLVDDGSGKPLFLLRGGSCYLVEITVMHAKGQQLPDQTAVESLVLEAPDGSKQTLQLETSCRSKSQLMVSALWDPGSSRSKLVSAVTPKKLWGRDGSVPLNLNICLTMCLMSDAAAAAAAAGGSDVGTGTSDVPTLTGYVDSVNGAEHQGMSYNLVPVSGGQPGSSIGGGSMATAAAAGGGSRFGKLEPVWVNSELVVRVCPENTSFKYTRAFRYMEECWSALPPEARGVMQGLVLLVRGVAGGATAVTGLMRV